MAIHFECDECGKAIRVGDKFAGKKLRCPGCEAVIKIPAAEEDDGEEEFFDEDVEQEERPARRGAEPVRASGSARTSGKSTKSGRARRRTEGDDNYFRPSTTKKSKKSKAPQSNAVLIWSIVIGGGVIGLAVIGTVVVVGINWISSARQATASTGQGQQAAPVAANSDYVTAETDTPISKFKMVWEMPAKWTQQSGVEDGFWPWAEMKGQGQTMKISSNRSMTEASSTMTSVGGFTESLKTAHTVRMAKLQLEYNDFQDGPLNVHEGENGPVVWSEYEYKGVFGKGYGIRCTLPGPRLPCTLVMEYAQSARDKWRPIVLRVAESVRYVRNKSAGDDGGDDDFFVPDGGGPPDAGGDDAPMEQPDAGGDPTEE